MVEGDQKVKEKNGRRKYQIFRERLGGGEKWKRSRERFWASSEGIYRGVRK